jgi:hypothetical protein
VRSVAASEKEMHSHYVAVRVAPGDEGAPCQCKQQLVARVLKRQRFLVGFLQVDTATSTMYHLFVAVVDIAVPCPSLKAVAYRDHQRLPQTSLSEGKG